MRVICTLRTVRSPSGLCSFITVFHMKWLICPEDLIYSIWCWKKQQKLVLICALASPPLSLFSGMFFDGNHTYMIEPGGHGSSNVSTADGSSQQGLSICPSSMFLHPAASTSCWAVWGQFVAVVLCCVQCPPTALQVPRHWWYPKSFICLPLKLLWNGCSWKGLDRLFLWCWFGKKFAHLLQMIC